MALRVIEIVEDDFDGKPADATFVFGLGDDLYEIDLTKVHGDQLKMVLAPFSASARHVGRVTRALTVPRQRRSEPADAKRREREKAERVAAREWARGRGVKGHDRRSVLRDR